MSVRGRGYSYLIGDPALAHGVNDGTRRSVGRTAARITKALKGFQHPAATRLNLWDLCHVGDLGALMADLAPSVVTDLIGAFLNHFNRVTKPSLGTLRRQVIHNDLSPSNMVVCAERPEQIAGVLDFGDMIEAPLLCELAIAASYQLSGEDPLAALRVVVSGFVEITPLAPAETRLLLDFVLARLVGRILIGEWRAKQFPENRDYILRSNGQARDLLETLMPIWRTADDRDWQDFFRGEDA
jgi:Ser/Thr protein kinase RdoA (MazF antagonist)